MKMSLLAYNTASVQSAQAEAWRLCTPLFWSISSYNALLGCSPSLKQMLLQLW